MAVDVAKQTYDALTTPNSNSSLKDNAVQYYYEHYDAMNEAFPDLKSAVLSDTYSNEKMRRLVEKGYSEIESDEEKQSYTQKYFSFSAASDSTAEAQKAENYNEPIENVAYNLLGNSYINVSAQDNFKYPDMGEYYLGAVDDIYLKKIDETYRGLRDAEAAASYASKAPEKQLGYNPENDTYFLKYTAKKGTESTLDIDIMGKHIYDNRFGSDYIVIPMSALSSREGDTATLERLSTELSKRAVNAQPLQYGDFYNSFELKILGLTAPATMRWCYEQGIPLSEIITETIPYYKAKEYSGYICRPYANEKEEVVFIKVGSTFHELFGLVPRNRKDETYDFWWLLSAGSQGKKKDEDGKEYNLSDSAQEMRSRLNRLLKVHGEFYIRFQSEGLSNDSTTFPTFKSMAFIDPVENKQLENFGQHSLNEIRINGGKRNGYWMVEGYNFVHMNNYRRYLGEIWLKDTKSGKGWINVSKLLANDNRDPIPGVTWNQDYEGNMPWAYDLSSYDVKSKWYADAFFKTIDELDDRKDIQKELHGVSWEDMSSWKVTLGDATFFVPPINIRLQTTTRSQRLPLLRSRGTATKTSRKQTRVLAMDIFFNEERGINGAEYTTTFEDPKKTKVTYYMNGLRAVLSMFKFTPFLPITNDYINKTLGIDAVVMTALQVSSVPNYPKLIHASLTMAEFDWRVYMPDIVQLQMLNLSTPQNSEEEETEEESEEVTDEEEAAIEEYIEQNSDTVMSATAAVIKEELENVEYRNWFATAINWKTFRYYYQRPIRRGNELKKINYDFNDDAFIAITCGGLTSFIPMDFQDSGIRFYMANEEYLQKVLKARYEFLQTSGTNTTVISFSESEIRFLRVLGQLNDILQEAIASQDFQKKLATFNEHLNNYKEYYVWTDARDTFSSTSETGAIRSISPQGNHFRDYIKDCLFVLDESTKDFRLNNSVFFEQNVGYISNIAKDGTHVTYGLTLKLGPNFMSDLELATFKKKVSSFVHHNALNEVGDYEGPYDSLFGVKENRLIIPLSIQTVKDAGWIDVYKPIDGAQWEINGESPAMILLSIANAIADRYSDGKTTGESVPDIEALMNLKYDAWEIPDILVTHWSATMINRVANIHVLSSDGFAPQYLGGEDVNIHLTIQTTNKDSAALLTSIPTRITRLTRLYHQVMPCVPLRVDSEFTKFLGTHEFTVDESYITTEQNHPGLYTVNMQLTSLDRTVREKEAGMKRAIDNAGYHYYDNDTVNSLSAISAGIGGMGGAAAGIARAATTAGEHVVARAIGSAIVTSGIGAAVVTVGMGLLHGFYTVCVDYASRNNAGSVGSGREIKQKYTHYLELKDVIAEVDLYPDLELPTIMEMEAIGYNFVRYKFQDERLYVDPDFYFVYPVQLTSAYHRELALLGTDKEMGTTKYLDATGAQVTIKPQVGTGYAITEYNDIYEQQRNIAEEADKRLNYVKQEKDKEKDENLNVWKSVETPLLSTLRQTLEDDLWNVCNEKIQVRLLEQKFYKEILSYKAREKANKAGNVDTKRGTDNAANTAAMNNKHKEEQEDQEEQDSDTSKVEGAVFTEGQFAAEKADLAKDAAITFYNYLLNTPIDSMFENMSGTVETLYDDNKTQFFTIHSYSNHNIIVSNIVPQIKSAVTAFMQIKEVQEFFDAIYINRKNTFIDRMAEIVIAAACAATAPKEYAGKESADWYPDPDFIGVKIGGYQNTSDPFEMRWSDEINDKDLADNEEKKKQYLLQVIVQQVAAKCAKEFGIFRIKMYSAAELKKIIHKVESVPKKPKEKKIEQGNINYNYYLLDPYYRSKGVEDIQNYKSKCIVSTAFCTYAYLRLLSYWLIRLVYDYILPNISTDYLRKYSVGELEIEAAQSKKIAEMAQGQEGLGTVFTANSSGVLVALSKYIDFYNKNPEVLDSGKIWTAAVLASTSGDKNISERLVNRDYGALNSIIETCSDSDHHINIFTNPGDVVIRKMVLALEGRKVITDIKSSGSSQTNPMVTAKREAAQKMYIAAAEDPQCYLVHSYHDMVVYDARGRMLRAFPTFYMVFIDEGREIGFWKLHDNFYNIHAIMEMEIIKSRKIPADTCRITLSNFYGSFATEMEDYIRTPVASFDDAVNSIFSPAEYFATEEVTRKTRPREVKLRLRPGTRLHIRMGYGNNAAMLPPLFNGVIAELSSEETVNIIAQGDGIELMNPIGYDKEAHNIDKLSDLISNSADNGITPLEFAVALFRAYPGTLAELTRKQLKVALFPRNPFGIVHFGEPDFDTFCKTGEPTQNLFEMVDIPLYGGVANIDNKWYDRNDQAMKTKITFDMFQKTPWECLNICKSMLPDAILGVAPFGFRSTVFMGMPRFYYAYDYYKDIEGVVQERRKPYQQWHIYTAEQDIIGNGIVATNRDMKTVAVGMYQQVTTGGVKTQQTVGPLYADWDLYPECQKSMVVDTSLLGKGIPYAHNIIGILTNQFDPLMPEEGPYASFEKIAWKMTASALRASMMDMYAGDLVVFGDPSVKPHDRMFIYDRYTGLSGQTLVKEVVHRMSVEEGFTTTISPDCIVTVHNRHEDICQTHLNTVGGIASFVAQQVTEQAKNNRYTAITGSNLVFSGITGLAGGYLLGAKLLPKVIQKMKGTAVNMGIKAWNKVIQKISSFLLKRGVWTLGGIIGGAALGTSAGPLGTTGGAALGVAVGLFTFFFGPFVNAHIEQALKSYKTCTVYPLKKFGYAYTAGMEGARGTVFGSPTWGDRGSLGELLDWIADNPIISAAQAAILDENTLALLEKFKRDHNLIDESGKPTKALEEYENLVKQQIGQQYKADYNDYRSIQLALRAKTRQEILSSYNQLRMLDINNYQTSNNINDMRLISSDSRLKPYIKEQFFSIIHLEPGLPKGSAVFRDMLTIQGKEQSVKIIKTKDSKGNLVFDIPVLSEEAINVLYEIVRRAKNNMPSANATDQHENNPATKTDYIVLKSALRVGDKSSMASTGYTFVLEGTGDNSKKALKAALESLHAQIEQESSEQGLESDCIYYRQQDGKEEVAITVALPKVRENPDGADTENVAQVTTTNSNSDTKTSTDTTVTQTDTDTAVTQTST